MFNISQVSFYLSSLPPAGSSSIYCCFKIDDKEKEEQRELC